ncbi:hypothetical protein [Streptomyces indicus]|uniref:Uncharacterized protein n=1 Tax=Streptomyces indicus TaxID=417292 RepID=A0A1G9JMP9_9ACTN|nr:hypothetical protein [Streptomyces indicus]SDL38303.1 hypothetical protein SAMN05421806_13232 [Streptomyces indicus]
MNTPTPAPARTFVVDAETRALFEDVVAKDRPQLGDALAVVRADAVPAGALVLGCYPDGVSVEDATPAGAITHSDPYTAAPVPYDPACDCVGCTEARGWSGPVITLATETMWEACDPVPAAAPVLVRLAA